MRRELLVSFLLVMAVAAVYWPVHTYPFLLLDDQGYVVQNPYVREGLTCAGLLHAFSGITVGNWHPLTMLSHMLDCQLFGVDAGAGWHHMVNLALHAANSVLLFLALRRMTGALWRSALVAALFGLHPLHVESVAWVSERKDVLSTLFFLCTLLAYHRYVQRPTVLRYTAVFVVLALGLMSKPMLVTAPCVLLLLDYWPLGRMRLKGDVATAETEQPLLSPVSDRATSPTESLPAQPLLSPVSDRATLPTEGLPAQPLLSPVSDRATLPTEGLPANGRPSVGCFGGVGRPSPNLAGQLSLSRLIAEKTPLLLLAAVSAVITYGVQQGGGAMGMLGQEVPLGKRLGNALFSYGQYLEKCFWPSPLSAVYPYVSPKAIDVLIVGLALGAISVATIRLARIRPFLLVGWCWYLGTLVPVIGLVQVGVQSMADRYTYIPLIGIFIIVAWGAAEFTEQWSAGTKAVVAAAVLAACGWFTWRQVATWSSSEAMYRHAVEAERYNFFAMYGLGMVYWKDGKLGEAQQQFEDILKIQSDPAVRVQGGFEPAQRALGLLLAVQGHPRQALAELDEAIDTRPQQPEPLRHKAWILATWPKDEDNIRDGKEAVELARLALEKSAGKQPEYWDTLAAAEAEAGNFKEAVAAAEKALQQARAMRADDLVPGIQDRLELFENRRPYHAPAQYPQRL